MRPLDPTREPDDRGFDDAAVDYDGATHTFDQVERLHLRKRLEPDFEWLDFDRPSPRNGLRVPLRQARVGLVVTAGVHLPGQRPARQIGEVRHIPVTASQVRLTHGGYDTQRAMQDPDVVFPTGTLRRLAETGSIGSVAPVVASTMGYIPKGGNVLDRVVPPVVASLVSQQVDLALLVPAWPVCQQSVGLLQRGLDHAGLPTVSITQAPSISRHARPSLTVFVAHPFGLTLGAPGDDATHQAVARTVLAEAERDHLAGTIVATGFRWPDDLRARQLCKQAH